VIARHQQASGGGDYQGVSFMELYRLARAEFLGPATWPCAPSVADRGLDMKKQVLVYMHRVGRTATRG